MKIVIDTDPKAPTRWRWIILDNGNKAIAGTADGDNMTVFEAIEASRAFMLAQSAFYQSLYAHPAPKKPLDLTSTEV